MVFLHAFISASMDLLTIAYICDNVMLQIKVQMKKVTLEVVHLQELLLY